MVVSGSASEARLSQEAAIACAAPNETMTSSIEGRRNWVRSFMADAFVSELIVLKAPALYNLAGKLRCRGGPRHGRFLHVQQVVMYTSLKFARISGEPSRRPATD